MRLSALASVALLVACSPIVSFLEPAPEDTFEVCDDGVDNDLDGDLDCADEGCAAFCNRCGDVRLPVSDELGQLCTEDCECPSGSACNPEALIVVDGEQVVTARCAPAPVLEDDGFDIAFTVENFSADGGVDPSRRSQNVLGSVRFNGVETRITSATWDLTGQTITFAAPPEAGQQSVLFVRSFPVPQPWMSAVEMVTIGDEIEVDSLGQVSQTGQFGPVPSRGAADLALNQVAVVESSTIAFDPLDQVPAGYWRGRYSGRLRSAAGFDRWSACRTGGDLVYDADTGSCFEPPVDEALFYLACAYRPNASRKLGGIAFSWEPWWGRQRETFSVGECATRREADIVRIRAAVDARVATTASRSWVLELSIPRFSVVSDVGLRVGADADVAARFQPSGQVQFTGPPPGQGSQVSRPSSSVTGSQPSGQGVKTTGVGGARLPASSGPASVKTPASGVVPGLSPSSSPHAASPDPRAKATSTKVGAPARRLRGMRVR